MKASCALATFFCLGIAAPAMADWDRIGTVEVTPDHFTQTQWSSFGGPVARLSLRADDRVDCDHIRILYRNGTSQEVFSGTLYGGQNQIVSFPEGSREVRTVDFSCRARSDGAQIALWADIGPYQAAWRGSPDWNRRWSHMMSWNGPESSWKPLASQAFGQWTDHAVLISGDDEHHVRAIALRPVGADARCRRVRAAFADGSTNDLVLNDGDPLIDGHTYSVEITGRGRDLNGIDLTCHAENDDEVTIQVYAIENPFPA